MPETEADILKKIQTVVARGEQSEIELLLNDISQISKRKEKKELLEAIHSTVIEMAFRENHPELTKLPAVLPKDEIYDHIRRASRIFIDTKDRAWLQAVYDLSGSLDRKSSQSMILSEVTKEIIEAGVDRAEAELIDAGMEVFHQISFRKYRSAILMDIVPLHIVWSITIRDTSLLTEALKMIEGIGDISKRSLLQSEVTRAIGRIGVAKRDFPTIILALENAAEIKQKIRRIASINVIVAQVWKSPLSTQVSDIPAVLKTLEHLPETQLSEVAAALTGEMISRASDKGAAIAMLEGVEKTYPFTLQAIIGELLQAAERNGDPYFLEAALRFNSRLRPEDEVQIKEIVRAGTAVVERTGEAKFLLDIVPLIEEAVSGPRAFAVYLQLVQTMLGRGAFSHAVDIFGKITSFSEIIQTGTQFWDTSVMLVSAGVLRDRVDQIRDRVFALMDTETKESLIQRSITEIARNTSFGEIIHHISSIVALAGLHRHRDDQLLLAIDHLIERKFIDSLDPSYLVEIARQISNREISGAAVSRIVANMSDFGVSHQNRDYLQRAVGLTCEIRVQKIRSEALCSVIDRAADLAVSQGDLTLLKRMRGWTDPLLEKEFGLYTTGNIVKGMVKYGINRIAPHALENAYEVAGDIDDPSLRQQLNELIIEGLIRVGCLMMQEPLTAESRNLLENRIAVFRRANKILGDTVTERRYSIRIARGIDIITEYLSDTRNPYYAIPLVMFVLEIRSQVERDAMVARIAAEFEPYIDDLASTDPYEMMAFLLQRLEYASGSPEVMDLTKSLLLQIANPYTRYSGMCTLAEGYLRIHDLERGWSVLREIHEGVGELTVAHEKALILSDIAGLMAKVDPEEAYDCFQEAMALLPAVDPEMGGIVRKHLVFSLVSLHAIEPREENIAAVTGLIEAIEDPTDYVNSLISAFTLVAQGDRAKNVMESIYAGIDAIPLPYDRASMLLSVVPIAVRSGEKGDAERLLVEADALTADIHIPVVSALVKKGICQMYLMLAATEKNEAYKKKGIEVVRSIEDEILRIRTFGEIGISTVEEVEDPAFRRLMEAAEEVLAAGSAHPDISSLEYLIEGVSDRAQRARYCFELFLHFRDAGRERAADNILLLGLDEASIIRPLSRRVYVLCGLALSLQSIGEKKKSRDIIGMAVNAATNIRQDDLRDEVFNELDVVMRVMQEGRV
ncbi:hypothetical protein Metli_1477 [Methanofollis liminatans DSM 4140]|uniref:Uncharacterized protein n=1 Tax=Methanofollis liminatans DSM 4140 TaxID=28892 RepID=J1AR31_9EURY|nr:hypothetical protein [Methanofollis liminatans]EJG07428.1 hypothetical protein Metli_1477 [Methanofollis liminatans DSM 4140]